MGTSWAIQPGDTADILGIRSRRRRRNNTVFGPIQAGLCVSDRKRNPLLSYSAGRIEVGSEVEVQGVLQLAHSMLNKTDQ